MYNLAIFMKNSPIQSACKFSDKDLAMAARQNILDKKKESIKSKENMHIVTKTESGDYIDFWADDLLLVMLMFVAEGFQQTMNVAGRG